ncbi:MAG: hypothetical protein NTW65_04345 [Deltaproteobacteria bacterium]|nr:hypothetical protein [Deltaproteobacteria bacterium]
MTSSDATILDVSGMISAATGKPRKAAKQSRLCLELVAFRSLFEKLACVNQEDFTWTWDHETYTFLIQAQNNVIQQYVNILTHELGEALCLHLKRATIIVDLRPWKTNPNKTSLRIGFEGSHIPAELQGHTGLEGLIKLHFISREGDSLKIKKALNDFKRMCARIDSLLERKSEWMWERHWRPDGLAFAVVRAYTWFNKYVLVEKEIELFNNSPAIQEAGLRIELSTYNRGTSFNVRIALDGLPNNLRTGTNILDVFDTHFSGLIS